MTMKKHPSILSSESGAVLPLIGISIVLLIAFMGVAIDSGRYFLARNKLMNALDASLIAVADIATKQLYKDDPNALQERGREFFRANFPQGYLGTNVTDADLVINFDPNAGKVTGSVKTRLPLVFGGIYNDLNRKSDLTSLGMDVFSEVSRSTDNRTIELAIAVDETPSMCYELQQSKPWGVDPVVKDAACLSGGTSKKFQAVKDSINLLVGSVKDAVATSDNPLAAYYAYIPFTHNVSIDGSLADFNFIREEQKDKVQSALGLSNDPTALLNAVNNTQIAFEGGTNVAMGMWWGWAALRPDAKDLFTGSSRAQDQDNHPTDFEKVKTYENTKVLVLLTDGQEEYHNVDRNNYNPENGGYAPLSGDKDGFQHDVDADTRLQNMCEQIKQQSIQLCTISFDVPPNSATASLLANCATPGCSYNASSEGALKQAFEDIANRLISKRITQ